VPVTANTLYTLALALSAWVASIAFHRYVGSYPAALLGGLVYGFSPAMIAQSSSHLHLTLGAVLPPLLLLVLDDLLVGLRRHRVHSGALLGLGTAAVVLAVLAAWPLAVQFLGPQRIAGDIQESSRNGNDLYSFLVPTRIMALAPAAPSR
jgi:hypothetical protein